MQPKADGLDKERQRVKSTLRDSSPTRKNNIFMPQLCYEYSNTTSNIALEMRYQGPECSKEYSRKKKWINKKTRGWSLPGKSKCLCRGRLLHWNLAHISHSLNIRPLAMPLSLSLCLGSTVVKKIKWINNYEWVLYAIMHYPDVSY